MQLIVDFIIGTYYSFTFLIDRKEIQDNESVQDEEHVWKAHVHPHGHGELSNQVGIELHAHQTHPHCVHIPGQQKEGLAFIHCVFLWVMDMNY